MTRVFIRDGRVLHLDKRWDASLWDAIVEAAVPLIEHGEPDALIVSAPTSAVAEGQLNAAAMVADRLQLARRAAAFEIGNGDASGAAALHVAVAYVKSGLARRVLAVGGAKVSDGPDASRSALSDSLLDQECEQSLGLNHATLCGLMAETYVRRHRLEPSVLAHIVARNYANAALGADTWLKGRMSAEEIKLDVPCAAPLVRSDFAPMADGACAILIVAESEVQRSTDRLVEVVGMGSCSDVVAPFERDDPIAFAGAALAARGALAYRGHERIGDIPLILVDNACSLIEALALEAMGIAGRGEGALAASDGAGRISSGAPVINPDGGSLGRGHVFGMSGLIQACEAFDRLSGKADGRYIAAVDRAGSEALALAVSGLGAQWFATSFRRQAR